MPVRHPLQESEWKRSRKRERMVEAKASIIELASVNREMISPVRRVAKERHRKFKNMANIG